MNTTLRRSVAALATALACLALMASPASATTHTPTITSGNIELVGGSTLNLPWAGTTGTGCGHSLTLFEDGTNYEVIAYSSRSRGTFLGSAYVAVVTRTGSTQGAVSGSTTLTASSTLSLQIQFFTPLNPNPATDCATTGVARCTYNVTLHLGGGVTGWTASSTGTLSYPTQALSWGGGQCVVPFATWLTGTVNAGGFSFHI